MKYQASDDAIAPSSIRRELFKSGYLSSKFKINETDDASEAFECILGHLHKHAEYYKDHDRCIAHKLFYIDYEVIKMCKCGIRD